MSHLLKSFGNTLEEFYKLSQLLQGELADDIERAEKIGWDQGLLDRIKVDVRTIVGLAARIFRLLTVFVLCPLALVIIGLVRHTPAEPYGLWYVVAAVWTGFVALFGFAIFWRMIPIVKSLHSLPPAVYRMLAQPLWLNVDFLNISASAVFLCYMIASWRFTTSAPIVVFAIALWFLLPLALFIFGREIAFIKVRLVQLILLLLVTGAIAVSPVPVSHYEAWAQREAAQRMRPVDQREVTADWVSLQWFTQEGTPLVWYSGDKARGYRLWTAPGHDPQTNEELKLVQDAGTKDEIVGSFRVRTDAEVAEQLAEEAKNAARRSAEADERAREAIARDQRVNAELREALAREYVYSEDTQTGSKSAVVALMVIDDRGEERAPLRDRVLAVLAESSASQYVTVFRPTFVQSPIFQDLLAGKMSEKGPFKVSDYASYLLVVRTVVVLSKEQAADSVDIVAADATWEVSLIATNDSHRAYGTQIRVRGVGFQGSAAEENATAQALEKLKKIAPLLVRS